MTAIEHVYSAVMPGNVGDAGVVREPDDLPTAAGGGVEPRLNAEGLRIICTSALKLAVVILDPLWPRPYISAIKARRLWPA